MVKFSKDILIPVQLHNFFHQERILSLEEWNRVQNNLHARKREIERKKLAKAAKDKLHEESKKSVKHWPNTIEVRHSRVVAECIDRSIIILFSNLVLVLH